MSDFVGILNYPISGSMTNEDLITDNKNITDAINEVFMDAMQLHIPKRIIGGMDNGMGRIRIDGNRLKSDLKYVTRINGNRLGKEEQ